MLTIKTKGDFSKVERYLKRVKKMSLDEVLDKYGKEGVIALSSATPVNTGLTARSWYYEIVKQKDGVTLKFNNSNIQNGVPIAIILQYGHGTGTGGWVEGTDYINPSIQPIFDKLASDLWREVTRL